MLAPTTNLTLDVTAGFAVVGQALVCKLDAVKGCDDAVHFIVNVAALGVGHVRQRLVPQNAARHKFHDVKGSTDDGFVFAQDMHFCNGNFRSRKSLHDCKLAFNGVCRRQQFGHGPRFCAHDIRTCGGDQFVGGVGLAALEHFDA